MKIWDSVYIFNSKYNVFICEQMNLIQNTVGGNLQMKGLRFTKVEI